MRHIRQCNMCSAGARSFFTRHGFNWRYFLKHGIEAERFIETGDSMALEVVKVAIKENSRG